MGQREISELEAQLEAAPSLELDARARLDAMTELAWALRNADIPRANDLAREARDLAQEHDYRVAEARATRTMAMTVSNRADLESVLHLGLKAVELFDQTEDGAGRAGSRDFMASVYEHMGDLAGGLAMALDALSIAREIEDPIRQGYALSNVGGILAASGEAETAVEHLKEALQLFDEAQDMDGVATICNRLSTVLKDTGQLDEALMYAARVHEAAKQSDIGGFTSSALSAMGDIEVERGRNAEAEKLYREALAQYPNEMMRTVVGSTTQLAIGKLILERGALDEAEEELIDALSHVEGEAVSIVVEADLHEVLARVREQKGVLGPALQHLKRAKVLREQVQRREARNQLVQLEARVAMEGAKKDAEIHKLRFVELHGMQAKLLEAERMALLGKLAAGTGHELNTPLGVLRSNTQMVATAAARLVALLPADEAVQKKAGKLTSVIETCNRGSEEAVHRLETIAQSFKRFSQLDQAELRTFDVTEGVQGALALLEPTLPDGITIECRFAPVPVIQGWARELNHAFMTVLQNAIQAMEHGGLLSVETKTEGAFLLVVVRDDGRGMTAEQVKNLFDVSWSEDGQRTQMRLGLSAAYSTMQKHGGSIQVQSEPGQGTEVCFRFPQDVS